MKAKTRTARPSGFALVVTLSMMILLTVIAVGLLSLGSVSLRTSGQTSDMSVARANARMALMLAIGELQKTTGPDTRVTARADILDENNPQVLGVWESWMGDDHDSSGRPIAPNYSNHKQGKFLGWLTSDHKEKLKQEMNELPETTAASGDRVALIGENTVGTRDADKRQIHLTPQSLVVNKSRGSFAWWVGGENQKARLPRPYAPEKDTSTALWSVLAKTHSVSDPAPFGLDAALLNHPSLTEPGEQAPADKVTSIQQSDLLTSPKPAHNRTSREHFYDLSTDSVGLLTNTATGGWRKDLNLMSENVTQTSSGLSFFRVNTKKDLMYRMASANSPTPSTSLLYPWSSYRTPQGGTNVAIYSFPAIGSWANLVNYASLYRNMSKATGNMTGKINATGINGSQGTFIHTVRVMPVIARVQWIYSHFAKGSATQPGKLDLCLQVLPVITMWNPYNVSLQSETLTFRMEGTLPPLMTYTVGGATLPKRVTVQDSRESSQGGTVKGAMTTPEKFQLNGGVTFAPGEAKVFSPPANSNILMAGYQPSGGKSYVVAEGVTTAAAAANSKITTSMSFDAQYKDPVLGVGMYLDVLRGDLNSNDILLAYRMLYKPEIARASYPAKDAAEFPQPTMAAAASAPVKFLSVSFGARMASNTHMPSKGFVQSSPFVGYTAMGEKATQEVDIGYSYPGVNHNVNSPFEFSFQGIADGVGTVVPDVEPAKNSGYIVTGYKKADGLSRCIVSELPGRPLASLAELQNWDARFENPIPPYSYNLVGNSDATPLIPRKAVVNGSSSRGAVNLQHDDSYCLNHVLFDDWFCSSLAREPSDFGTPPNTSNAKTLYENLLKDNENPLANRAYKPSQKDKAAVALDPQMATTLSTQNIGTNSATSWKTIASRLEVEGMFNVNSTSVTAWRALLGHARNQRIPHIGASGSPKLSDSLEDYAFSRFSVAGDVEARQGGTSGAFGNSAQFAGYRKFTAGQLDFLAGEIVKQVRLRGPFLSLSEFVNRQLSDDDGLAMAGAIQTALNKLTESSQNPFQVVQSLATQGTVNLATENPPPGQSGYLYPKAAVGYRLYGLPGWTRQADILRPIAPILSARDDTFTIRAYGDCRDAGGTIIKARATCEATVRRSREYVDPANDAAAYSNASGAVPVKLPANELFGRRYEMVSFRWLADNEI
ncbi:hypothetical protein JIN84_13715 [Luteolibacter yonseiensis]|uniref:Verru_Chthon cassette protein A n=1 Tax=Luteolibacter yonseiensis TaxID=1144680 RepID=A0A934R1J3_9BACT|nr:hypothetical protein [Luteolibacter yonseiensis]MBK1816678.1 hypothetical protein [Luteolibacter yonseiensis]